MTLFYLFVYSISDVVGSLPPKKSVRISITYVTESFLLAKSSGMAAQIHFVFPRAGNAVVLYKLLYFLNTNLLY